MFQNFAIHIKKGHLKVQILDNVFYQSLDIPFLSGTADLLLRDEIDKSLLVEECKEIQTEQSFSELYKKNWQRII